MTITEQLAYSTVRIECEMIDGQKSCGSGYFFQFKYDVEKKEYVPVVITNKHVIDNSKKGKLIFTIANNNVPIDKEHFEFDVDNFESFWKKHPDPEVDLCAMPIAPFLQAAEVQGKNLFFIPLDFSLVPDETKLATLSGMEEIVMVGYPNGIWDAVNNKPIFRKGVTATHPCTDYNGKKEFMIDAACFPGSSGSPVFILNENGYSDKNGKTYLGAKRILLMGTLFAGPQHIATGEIEIVTVPTAQKPIAISSIPNNLGLVIKSLRIKELETLF
ncbi:MAG: serine protease [Smithellaceae bacterium]